MLRLIPNGRKGRLLLAVHRMSERLTFETVWKAIERRRKRGFGRHTEAKTAKEELTGSCKGYTEGGFQAFRTVSEGEFSEVPLGDSPESSTRNGTGHPTVFGGHLALPYQRESRRSQKVQRQHHQRVQTHPKNRAPGSEDQAVDVDAGE
jgi:hypothetical protein